MKHFLQLLMLTGLLFGQDVLILKSGESFEGAFYGKVGEDIVFKVPLSSSVSSIFLKRITSTKKFPIWSGETIVTKNGELTYPLLLLFLYQKDNTILPLYLLYLL